MTTVYRYRKWDIICGDYVVSRSKATAAFIAEIDARIIEESAEQVSVSELDRFGRYKIAPRA